MATRSAFVSGFAVSARVGPLAGRGRGTARDVPLAAARLAFAVFAGIALSVSA
jgi:hypothetical protein